jgi:hypothetical protein
MQTNELKGNQICECSFLSFLMHHVNILISFPHMYVYIGWFHLSIDKLETSTYTHSTNMPTDHILIWENTSASIHLI